MKAIKINGLPNRCRAALYAAAITGLLVGAPTYAQDDSGLEEIVVVGLRGSLERSLDIKRESAGFVDAVSAEDVGKLPDQNVAEALEEVPGVAIQRSRGEGDFVSIRGLGPDFVRGSVNGRSFVSATEAVDPIFNGNLITSTGRAANFDILPSEIINTLEVIKSPSAEHVEGGIGGVVNVRTARPLALGNHLSGSLQGTYRDFNEETNPTVSALGSWVNGDETFGFLAAVAYSERSIREDFSRSFGWFPSFGLSTALDTDNDGTGDADGGQVPFPLSNNAEVYEEDRERVTLSATAQWSPDDSSDVTLDVMYSQREVDESHQNFIFLPIAFDADITNAGAITNPDGSVQIGQFLTDGTFSSIPSTLRPELTTDLQEYEDDLLTVGLNWSRNVGDWTLVTDLSYAKSEGESAFDRVRIDGDNGTFSFLTNVDNDGFQVTQNDTGAAGDLGNPANYVVSVFDDRFASNEDEEFALQFDAEKDIGGTLFSSLQVGARLRTREKNVSRASNGNGVGVIGAGITVADVGSFNRGASNFLDGDWRSNIDYASLVFPDNAATRAALANYLSTQGLSTNISPEPFSTFSIEEDTIAGYAQLNFDGDLGGLPFIGDVGVRIVQTRQSIGGFDAEFIIQDNGGMDTTVFDSLTQGAATPVTFDETYTNVLPSLNLRFELGENLYLRFAASESLTRPTFGNLAPALSINANSSTNLNGDNFAVSLGAGNPALKPYEATNFDLGVEWYFDEGGILYAGLFYKDLEDYIAVVTNNVVTEIAGQPIRAVGVEIGGASGPIAIDQVSQPDNQGVAEIAGLELGYNHAFDNGLGVIANVTLTENSAEFVQTGANIDFPGVSETSYNVAGYFENDRWQARLSYSFRSEYLLVPSAIGFGGQIFADDYGQLDGSISYSVTDDITVFLNAVNLADENQDQYTDLPGFGRRFYSESTVGPRYSIGVRASF